MRASPPLCSAGWSPGQPPRHHAEPGYLCLARRPDLPMSECCLDAWLYVAQHGYSWQSHELRSEKF
jgi:hypothetical protein